MAVIKKSIANGIQLNIIETDKFKTNYISVNFVTKLDKSTAAKNALLPTVLKRGTEKYPTMAKLNEQLDFLYATQIASRVYKRGETQIFGFSASILDNSYAPDGTDILGGSLDVLSEIIFHPVIESGAFKASYVESEKSNLIDNINAKINNKTSYAIWRCQEEMCKDEVFGIDESGTVQDVEIITPEILYNHYRNILNSAQIEIFFIGKCNKDELYKKIFGLFGHINHGKSFELKTEVIRKAKKEVEIVESQPVNQGKLSLGFRTGTVLSDGNYHIFSLFNELYGGSPSSKLFMNVREKLSLCYYCRSIPEAQKGIMIVTSGIEVDKKETTQAEILLQLENVKNGIISDEELESAKKSLINGYREINDSASALEVWYLGRILVGMNTSPDETSQLIDTVTKDEIMEIAKKITLDTVYFLRGTLTGGGEDE